MVVKPYNNFQFSKPHRGSFKIWNRNQPALDGLMAHMSSKACQKVCEEAGMFETVLQLEMVPKTDALPKSFKISPPSSENIALYFFPSNIRYWKSKYKFICYCSRYFFIVCNETCHLLLQLIYFVALLKCVLYDHLNPDILLCKWTALWQLGWWNEEKRTCYEGHHAECWTFAFFIDRTTAGLLA